MVALSLKVKNHPGGNLVSNYKPVTKTKMLVLVFAVGLVCLKSPFEGMLNFAELFEMKGGCAFFRVLTGCILLARRFGFWVFVWEVLICQGTVAGCLRGSEKLLAAKWVHSGLIYRDPLASPSPTPRLSGILQLVRFPARGVGQSSGEEPAQLPLRLVLRLW